MKHEWILDVLTDLKKFAKNNGFAQLAEQLDDTKLVAAVEIASKEKGPIGRGDHVSTGRYSARAGTSHRS